MKILIVGAGIGGLSLAAFLKDSNIDYDIIEKCPNWDHQGYSLSIWNN
ncbi:MAG: NAD(P)-binding protein, partial [Patescibacteria group bacterium]